VIDYENLVEAYRQSLTSVLRAFRPGEFKDAFLETWVPDEDDVKSLRGIFEAAAAAQMPRLAVRIGGSILRRAPPASIEAMAERFGAVTTTRDGEALLVEVAFERSAPPREASVPPPTVARRVARAPSPPVPAEAERARAYDAAIRALGPFTHEGFADVDDAVRVAVDHLGATLEVCVDARHVIVSARHRGGDGDTPAVLEALCRVIESLPVREAADHGAARLELALRGRGGARVVPGIVSPENVDPRIGRCAGTLRALLAGYALRAGSINVENEFIPPMRAEWARASAEERTTRARQALQSIARELGLEESSVELASVPGDARVVVAFTEAIPYPRRPSLLFEIERGLKVHLDDGVAVYLEEMADRNRIRRLVKPPEARR
jgi:hypothetical protein